MIELLKDDELVKRFGGRYRLTALVQKRAAEIVKGARPMVSPEGKNPVEIAVEEIAEGKVVPEEPEPEAEEATE